MNSIPVELKINILQHLKLSHLKHVWTLNKEWNELCKDNRVWKNIYDGEYKRLNFSVDEVRKILGENKYIWYTWYRKIDKYLTKKVLIFDITYSRYSTVLSEKATSVPYYILKKYFRIPYFDGKFSESICYFRFSGEFTTLRGIMENIGRRVLKISLFVVVKNNYYKPCQSVRDDRNMVPVGMKDILRNVGKISIVTITVMDNGGVLEYGMNYSSINKDKEYVAVLVKNIMFNYVRSYLV